MALLTSSRCRPFFSAVLFLAAAASACHAQAQDVPKTGPQDPSSTRGGQPGETLGDRLDRDNGVIKPPPGTDPAIIAPAPAPSARSTPVIPPPGTPGGDRSVQPK